MAVKIDKKKTTGTGKLKNKTIVITDKNGEKTRVRVTMRGNSVIKSDLKRARAVFAKKFPDSTRTIAASGEGTVKKTARATTGGGGGSTGSSK